MKKRASFSVIIIMILCFAMEVYPNPGVWLREIPDSTGVNKGMYNSIAVDRDNNTHIVYFDIDYEDLRYAVKRNNEWTVTVLDSAETQGISCDIAVDENNRPHISYVGGSMSNPQSGIKYITLTNEGWQVEIVDTVLFSFFLNTIGFTSINLNHLNQPCISYFTPYMGRLVFANRLGDDHWDLHTVKNIDGAFTGLMFKQDGSPVIRYYSGDSLMIAYSDTDYTNWQFEGQPVVLYPGINMKMHDCTMDSEDHIHLVQLIMDPETYMYNMEYVCYDWLTWTNEIIETELSWTSSIITNVDNEPLVLMDMNDLFMYHRDDGIWKNSLIDDQVDIGFFSSMALDTNHYPRIALQGETQPSSPYKDNCLICYEYIPGTPDIEVKPDTLKFDQVSVSSYLEKDFKIYNQGQAPLIIDEININNGVFTFSGITFPNYVSAGDSTEVTVRFTPLAEEEYTSDISIISNDPDEPGTTFVLCGTGLASGTTGSLTVTVNDVYYDGDYGDLYYDRFIEDARVELIHGGTIVYGPITTNAEGKCEFSDIVAENYQIQITKAFNSQGITESPLILQHDVDIGAGANSVNLNLPVSLYEYKYEIIYALTHIEKTYGGLPSTFTYEDAEDDVIDLLQGWSNPVNDNTRQSLARLILAEEMVQEMFDGGYSIGDEMIADIGELIGFLYYSNDWAEDLLKLFMTLIQSVAGGGGMQAFNQIIQMIFEEIVKMAVIQEVGEGIKMIAYEIPCPGDRILLGAWDIVKVEYLGYPNFSFNQSEWEHIRRLVFNTLHDPFIQEIYVDILTSASLENATEFSADNMLNGELTNAYTNKLDFVASELSSIETYDRIARGLRESAHLFMLTAQIFSTIGTMDPTGVVGDIANKIAFGMEMAAYGHIVTAIGTSSYKFFTVPDNMEDAIDKIYFPDGKPQSKSTLQQNNLSMYASDYSALVVNNRTAINEYNTVLEGIKTKINNDECEDAALELTNLKEAEDSYKGNLKISLKPLYAAASEANETVSGFSSQYDSLILWYANATDDRMHTYLNVFLLGLDDSEETKNAALSVIDSSLVSNEKVSNHIDAVLTMVTDSMEIPAIALISSMKQDSVRLLSLGHSSDIKIRVKNISSVAIQNSWMKIIPGKALSTNGQDSIFIGQLAGNQESDEYSFNVSLTSDAYSMATYTVELFADDAATFPETGYFNTRSLLTTGISKIQHDPYMFRCYPNPFDDEIWLEYSITEPCEVVFEVYDVLGKQINSMTRMHTSPDKFQFSLNTEEMDQGIYYIIFKIDGIQQSSRKVLHSTL